MTSLTKYELLDNCINITHYNISLYLYEILKNKYRYSDKQWYLYESNDNINSENKLKDDIKDIIINDFGNRSIYWSKTNNSDDNIKSVKLLQIIDKLKNEKFLKDIIKELSQFYE